MILDWLARAIAARVAARLDALIERRLVLHQGAIAEEALRLATIRLSADYAKRLEAIETHLRTEAGPDKTPAQLRLIAKAALTDVREIRFRMLNGANDAGKIA